MTIYKYEFTKDNASLLDNLILSDGIYLAMDPGNSEIFTISGKFMKESAESAGSMLWADAVKKGAAFLREPIGADEPGKWVRIVGPLLSSPNTQAELDAVLAQAVPWVPDKDKPTKAGLGALALGLVALVLTINHFAKKP